MTTRRRSPRRRFGSGKRTPTTWQNSALTMTLGTAGVLTFLELTPPPLVFAEDPHGTAVLLRTILTAASRQVDAIATVTQQYAIAMYVGLRQNILTLDIIAPLTSSS